MHQSWMLCSQRKNSACHTSGTKRILPASTACTTGSASGFMETNHCLLRSGSTTDPQRWQCPIE